MDSPTHRGQPHHTGVVSSQNAQQICQLCHEHLSGSIVSCNTCRQPYHTNCAKVSSPQELWLCQSCNTNSIHSASSTHSSIATKDSVIRKRALELKRLEEERELSMRRDQEYLNKKYKILEQNEEEDTDVQYPIDTNRISENPNANNTRPNLTSHNTSLHVPIEPNNVPITTTDALNPHLDHTYEQNNFTNLQPFQFNYPNFYHHSTLHQNLNQTRFGNLQNINNTQQSQSFINPGQTETSQPQPMQSMTRGHRLRADHLHARQTLPKDLPNFSGCPEEWPLFSSTYDWSTEVCGLTDAENLIRLQRALRGDALEAVKGILIHPSCVPHAISTLKLLYGQPDRIIFSLKNKIKTLPKINPDKMETITNFAIQVKGLQSTIEASGLIDELNNSSLLQELVSKLPPHYQIIWGSNKLHLQQCNKRPNLIDFSNWIFDIGLSASTVNVENNMTLDSVNNRKQKMFCNAHTETNYKKCVVCSGDCKTVPSCKKFLSFDRKERWSYVNKLQLCKHCLRKHTGACYNRERNCNVEGCQFKHHNLLHKYVNNKSAEQSSEKERDSNTVENVNTHDTQKQKILFKVMPIRIYGNNNKVISTYAFLDDGSSISLMDEELVNQLDLEGESEQLCLKWTGNMKRIEENSQRLTVQVSGNNSKVFGVDIRTVKRLLLPKQTLDYEYLNRKFNHLKNLPIESYYSATPKVLIGLNNSNLTISNKIKEGGKNEPIAIKTALGWTVFGPCGSNQPTQYNMHICECLETDNNINQLVKHYFNIESLGINYQNLKLNNETEKSLQLLNNFTEQRDDGHYETGLLWQSEKIILPNNYQMAKSRLLCLEKQLRKNSELYTVYVRTIEEYLKKGYITKIDASTPAKRIWYLPTFPVYNKNKPGKCRIVWDAAAKFNGISLNSMLYKGPDLLASLHAILFQFREKSVAICGDIEQMFHQVFIREEDRHVQRFLWRNCETDKEPDVYLMNVMIFGASCAPSISQYVKNTNASKYESQYPSAVSAVKNNHYVDDFLYSTDTVEQAVNIAQEVKYIQSQAGFNLRNWVSNKKEVVYQLEKTKQTNEKHIHMGSDKEIEKVLGVFWKPMDDTIMFRISPHILSNDIIRLNKYPTKRQILRILMTVYDPLGLVGNFVMYLKIILQEIWKSGVSWDEPIREDQYVKWEKWLKYLPDLEKVSIQRCYLKSIVDYTDTYTELHTFVDASENGYAAVSYLRIVHNRDIVCSLVGSKTRVAPLRMTSIPRLELMAALIGSRFANNIIQNHTIVISKKYFWSDSKTVISWLTNSNRKYHQFVSLRISEILDTTDLQEWQWIPGKQNVADEATKWARKPDISLNSRWFKGPDFLLTPEHEWPVYKTSFEPIDAEEVEYVQVHDTTETVIDINRFSSWKRLLRTTAYMLRFCDAVRQKFKSGRELESEELANAECLLYRFAQTEFYSEEIRLLKSNKKLSKSSSLYKATPRLDENQLLRVEGRIDKAIVPEDTKHPIILPRDSRITHLLIMDFHINYKHLNHESVVNEIRQRYYIPRLRAVIKTILKRCQMCKIKKATPNYPQMAKLPEARMAAFCRPFTYTGVDYFGPIMVTVGRRTEKRYGALFTCLTVRAVHIEVVNSLNTSSCIIAIRNFICRRGTPREFFSDNGTNFVSAEKEIREAVKEIDKNELIRAFTTSTAKWNFIPPSSPHMGGAWERLVRSIKNVFYNISHVRTPSDELLRGMLAEVENIINSRPLVYVPVEHETAEAITPNHLLLYSSNGMKPLASFDDSGEVLKNNWLASQQYAEAFWRKWIREYLPSLTLRTKWHEKTKPLDVGDLVIVVDPSSPRNVWSRGKVVETIMAKDGQVRKAKVLTSRGIIVRPATRLAVLDVVST